MELQYITVNGELDKSYERKQHVTAIVGHTARLGAAFGSFMHQLASEVITPVILELHDSQHGTHLREEYFEQKKVLATTALREEVGL